MSKESDIYLVVIVPSTGVWRSETAASVALMFSYIAVKTPKLINFQLMSPVSSMLCQNRETSVKKALQAGATHIFFIDSDMVFPKTIFNRLLKANKPFVAANCTTRAAPIETVAHDFDGKRVKTVGVPGLQKVQHTGLAVSLIRREVFAALRPPLFMMEWIPQHQAYCGEDVFFCQKVREAGFEIWIDHDVSRDIFHIGDRPYGHEDVKYDNA